ncbi:VOC family protein [Peribacillus frigoritolerans]|uniref:VOC family protein n=1 Tax=Peribacillus frigoritolerans TaxID=450367 RepID=UPI00203DE53E|nr:VOC family protein [Peribacillus frigoritolerans]MCM3166379.1 VOC family protein [Peribacillus frigoritolerans]
MTAITHVRLAVPDLDAAIKWYEQVLGFKLLAGPYSFDASEENEPNMTNDLLGDEVKKMRNAI